MTLYEVLIVEDDPMVAAINRQYTAQHPSMHVAAVMPDGRAALAWLAENPVDLIIADLYMPRMDGIAFLQALRAGGNHTDVIMVTAAADPASVQSLLALGVTDYLVKPFDAARFDTALNKFTARKAALQAGTLTQAQLDSFLGSAPAAPSEEETLEKGLQPKTLRLLTESLAALHGQSLTCDDISARVGLSRVTVRRYMNYLVNKNLAAAVVDYSTGGRPSILYRYLG